MKITSEELPQRQVVLEIEVEPERHALAVERAYKRLAPQVRIPGFRPGKAPRPLIERHLGRHRLLDEAMDILVPEVYREALTQTELDPVAQPSLELVSHEPFVFKAKVPLRPQVDLGDYRALRVRRERPSVTDEQMEEAMVNLRRRYGTVEPVDRPAQTGDIIRGNVRASVEGRQLVDQQEIEYRLTEGALTQLPGLAEQVAGLSKGAEVTREVQVADDFADDRLAGKVVSYHVVVHDVKEEKLAPLDDSFAQEVGEGFPTLLALRERVRADLKAAEDEAALRRYHDAVIDALVAQSSLAYPDVLVEREIDRVLDEQANLDPRDPRAQDLYISRLGKSEAQVRDEVRAAAELRLRRSLVLNEFAEAENIRVNEDDVETELRRMLDGAGEQADTLQRVFGSEAGRDSLRRSIFSRRVLERLVEIASAEVPEDAAAAEAAKPKRRRSSPRESG